jgi:hypothetical protein
MKSLHLQALQPHPMKNAVCIQVNSLFSSAISAASHRIAAFGISNSTISPSPSLIGTNGDNRHLN